MSPPKSESDGDIPDTHNFTEAVGTRLSPKTKRHFDEYKDQQEIGNSEALRRLIRTGLDAADDETDAFTDRLVSALMATLALGYPALAVYGGQTTTAVVWVGAVACYVLFQPQIDDALNRLPNPLNRLRNS